MKTEGARKIEGIENKTKNLKKVQKSGATAGNFQHRLRFTWWTECKSLLSFVGVLTVDCTAAGRLLTQIHTQYIYTVHASHLQLIPHTHKKVIDGRRL